MYFISIPGRDGSVFVSNMDFKTESDGLDDTVRMTRSYSKRRKTTKKKRKYWIPPHV